MTIRPLPPEEWHRLADHPYMKKGGGLPHPDTSVIVVAEDGEEIVAFWVGMTICLLEAAWIKESHRRGTLAYRVWKAMRKLLLSDHSVPAIYCFSANPTTADLLARLNFNPLPFVPFIYSEDPCLSAQPSH